MTSAAPVIPAPKGDREKSLLVIATGWGPSHGGINAFSLDFCLALGELLKRTARVICLTTPVADAVRAGAAARGVEIFTMPSVGPEDPAGKAEAARDLLRREGIISLDLIVGHDVFTGPLAIALRDLMGTMAAVIHHMSYSSYQAVKADGRTALQKEEEQRQLLGRADVVLAVGPLLKRSAERLCQRPVYMIVPGLAQIEPVKYRDGCFRAITFGRMGGADDRIKQGSLAAAGYGRFVRTAGDAGLSRDYRFNVFGLTAERYEEERAVRELVNDAAGRVVNVIASPYTVDRQELFNALSHNEVAMMLSWHEGFGLVGWEAIAAGVPLLVSRASGLYALLKDDDTTLGADCVHAVDIKGSPAEAPNEGDVSAVSQALFRIATDLDAAMRQARKLRDYLRKRYTWESCATIALEACGWATPLSGADGSADERPPAPSYPPCFEEDIQALRAHTRGTLAQQSRFSSLQLRGIEIKVRRACVSALVAAAAHGSVLVVGEPGAGKSGAQHDAVTALLASGADVLVFAADGLAAESLGGLRQELGLRHDVNEVLDNWGGGSPGYLVIDALDAARSERVAKTLRELIARVVRRRGRWRVVASIRKFDLRYSAELRQLMPGVPVTGFADQEFANVRHINIPLLDEDEMRQVAAQSDEIRAILDGADERLRQLLRVPFNLSLVTALLEEGVPASRLTPVQTQIELLDRYWDARVTQGGSGGEARDLVLRSAAEKMVRSRALRVPRSKVARDQAAAEPLREVLSANVLVEWQGEGASRPNQAVLAFSHHLLFDYGVSRLLRGEPGDLVSRLENDPDLALAIRPSIVLHFHHLWMLGPPRREFYTLVEMLQWSERVAEIAKTIGPGVAADLFNTADDVSPLVAQLCGG